MRSKLCDTCGFKRSHSNHAGYMDNTNYHPFVPFKPPTPPSKGYDVEQWRVRATKNPVAVVMESPDLLALLADFVEMRKALENVSMFSRREINRAVKASRDPAPWITIVRFCEEGGVKSSILRVMKECNECKKPESAETVRTESAALISRAAMLADIIRKTDGIADEPDSEDDTFGVSLRKTFLELLGQHQKDVQTLAERAKAHQETKIQLLDAKRKLGERDRTIETPQAGARDARGDDTERQALADALKLLATPAAERLVLIRQHRAPHRVSDVWEKIEHVAWADAEAVNWERRIRDNKEVSKVDLSFVKEAIEMLHHPTDDFTLVNVANFLSEKLADAEAAQPAADEQAAPALQGNGELVSELAKLTQENTVHDACAKEGAACAAEHELLDAVLGIFEAIEKVTQERDDLLHEKSLRKGDKKSE